MPGLSSNNECKHGLNQVMQSIAAPYQIGNHRVSVTASIGYTLYPSDDADADTPDAPRRPGHVCRQAGRAQSFP